AVAFVSGAVLRLLVRRSAIHPSRALHIIESISVLAGGAVGSVIVLVLLIILWPAAGNWIINTFLSDTLIWQTEFQQWITQKIDDPTTSPSLGTPNVVRYWTSHPTRAIRQRISRLPKWLGLEVAVGKSNGETLSRKYLRRRTGAEVTECKSPRKTKWRPVTGAPAERAEEERTSAPTAEQVQIVFLHENERRP